MQCVLKSTAKERGPLEAWACSHMCVIVYPHNLQRSLKETPWDLCGFLLTLHCELMGCWGKTSIGRENMRPALHKSSLLTVYDIGMEKSNIVPMTFASQNLQAFWDFVHPWGPAGLVIATFFSVLFWGLITSTGNNYKCFLPSLDLNFCQFHFPNLHIDLVQDCDKLHRTD